MMPNKVPSEEIKRRKQEVLRLAEQISYELHSQFIGRKMQVLLEKIDHSNPESIHGHTANFLMVMVPSKGLESNTLIDVELVANTPIGLCGSFQISQFFG